MRKLTVILLLISMGCSTVRLPPPLSASDKSKICNFEAVHAIVGVEKYKLPGYSDELIDALRRTHLFDKVNYIEKLDEKPNLIVQVYKGFFYEDSLDPFVGLFIGYGILFPTHSDTCEYGFDFYLSDAARPERKIRVKTVFADEGYSGVLPAYLYVGFKNLSPDWSYTPDKSARYMDHLRLNLVDSLGELGINK